MTAPSDETLRGQERPLFIPIKTEYFNAFLNGTKNTEYRKEGRMWNLGVCRTGRRVVLSKGYGKQHRLTGIIDYSWPKAFPLTQQIPGWKECYGDSTATAICIQIKLDLATCSPREEVAKTL